MSNKARSDESIARCPACGAEVWIHEVSYTDGDIWFTPRCSECNVALAENYPTYEDAVTAWNETWGVNGPSLVSLRKEAIDLLEAALKELMCADDDNGGCYGCIHLNADEKCTSELGRVMCDCKTNNMWRWQHADRYEALKAQSPTKNTDLEG